MRAQHLTRDPVIQAKRGLSILACLMGMNLATAVNAAPTEPGFNITAANVEWYGVADINGLLGVIDADMVEVGGDYFDDAMGLRVGGQAYGVPTGMLDLTGTTVTGSSQFLGGLDVTVQFHAFAHTPIMRHVVELVNNSLNPLNTTAQWINNSGNDGGQRTIATSTGDLVEGLDDRWIVTADSSDLNSIDTEANAWILYGPDGPTVTTGNVTMFENEASFGGAGDEGITADFNVTLGPGQRAYLMWFVALGESGNQAIGFANDFNSTLNPAFQALIADLPQVQLDNTLNWAGVAVVPEPSTSALIGVGLIAAWVSGRRRIQRAW